MTLKINQSVLKTKKVEVLRVGKLALSPVKMGAFRVENPDWQLSPHTGMTRSHWLEAAKFLVDGIFQHISGMDEPIVLPKQNKICYPQPDDPQHRFQVAKFEGLSRTMMAALPVFVNNPDAESNGLSLRDYYAHQIIMGTNPKSPLYWGRITDFMKENGRMQYQQTVEGAALAINLMNCRQQIWDRYSSKERRQVAGLISDYAHNLTIGHNWRSFNVLMLTFLKINGFSIDEAALQDHLQHLLSCYVGDGWYIDDTNYDFYNPWGYHFYLPIWCNWYGYEHEPEIAAIIEKRNREFIQNWPRFFSRDGRQMMWGRSIIYRFAASSAFGAHFLMNEPVLDPGFARRIASGNMLQFITRKDLYINGVPCLGYYGPFEPLVQFYSCAASPFWMAKTFVALTLPKESPFWTANENEGFWSKIGDNAETVELSGPGMQVVNYGVTGAAELRSGKVFLHETYYNQLQFNTHFCPEIESPKGTNAASYSIREYNSGHNFRIPLNIAFNKIQDGLLYRVQNTQPVDRGQPHKGGINRGPEQIDLVDISLPFGVLRVDRLRVPYRNELQLGHFALPHLDGKAAQVEFFEVDGHRAVCAAIEGRKVAMVAVNGWEKLNAACHTGLNPEAQESTVICAERIRSEDYSGMEIFITVMLHRLDGGWWTKDELTPVEKWEILPWAPSGNACGVQITLKDGRQYAIDYGNADGRRII